MAKLINPAWVVQFDWEELDGKLVEIQVHEDEGTSTIVAYNVETKETYVLDIINWHTVH